MIKLYRITDGALHYHEAWVAGDAIMEHWGTVGSRGQVREHPITSNGSEDDMLESVLAGARASGYGPLDLDHHSVLLIEYRVDPPMGTPRDVEKRYRLQKRMDETLGWTGLGHCDGGSIGSGTMEVCCFVVDFEVARQVVSADLAGTEFADYTRIFEE
jgi:hypothetical protein